MTIQQPLEWHRLDQLRTILTQCDRRGYLTVSMLMSDRKETQIGRTPTDEPSKLYEYVLARAEQAIPSTGRMRFRVRLWRAAGRPICGVVLRVFPRGSVRRRRPGPRPKHDRARSSCASRERELRELRHELEQEQATRRMLQDELTQAHREIIRPRSSGETDPALSPKDADVPAEKTVLVDVPSPVGPYRVHPKRLDYRRSIQNELLEQFTGQIEHMQILDVALPIAAAMLNGIPYHSKWQLLRAVNDFLSRSLISKPTLLERATQLPTSMARNGDVYIHRRGGSEDYMLRVSSMNLVGPDGTDDEPTIGIQSIQYREEERLAYVYRFFEVQPLEQVRWRGDFEHSLRGAIQRAQSNNTGLDPGYLRWLFHLYE